MKSKPPKHYPFDEIEPKWQKIWSEKGLYTTNLDDTEKKLYTLVMFPYPSGEKMHIGHWYNYGPTDTWARLKKMQGYNVFFPIGYDAFGLPAENFAIKHKVHPAISTKQNIGYFRSQFKQIGSMIDWNSEFATSDPEYYKWTQWLFIKLFENGLAYRKKAPVNWCPKCHTVLANEQVLDGLCERCESEVTKKDLTQWFFKITDYADRLLADHKKLDWQSKTITMQKNWIGKSVGSEIIFTHKETGERIPIFTTRADTLFGVTYMVLAPEHPLVEKVTTADNKQQVEEYQKQTRKASDIDRMSATREKTGVFTGAYCINPINGDSVPIWVADYVLYSYGTGAVMAVPGHDQRDWEFATNFNLPIKPVIAPKGKSEVDLSECAYEEYGVMINSGDFSGQSSEDGMINVTAKLERNKMGKSTVNYRLRDWLISRQRYWGAPIPIIFCNACGEVPVPESDLPVLLPDIDNYSPTEEGESPLARSDEFVNVPCPKCGKPAKRSVETMDTFVDSAWYFLRYPDANYSEGMFNPKRVKQWLPIDFYVGGAEHSCTHLIYARFITKVLHDLGYIDFDEPFLKLRHQGIISTKGAKISKSKDNVINPDSFIDRYGSDTFRIYLMFMSSYTEGGDWDDSGISGVARFLGRVYRLMEKYLDDIKSINGISYNNITSNDDELKYYLNYTIKKVGEDINSLDYNTAIAAMMEFLNLLYNRSENGDKSELFRYSLLKYIQILAPFAPHFSEEFWSRLKNPIENMFNYKSIFESSWPEYDHKALIKQTITMVAQINGKLRASFDVAKDISKNDFLELIKKDEKVSRHLEDKSVIKEIFVPGKLANIVVK
ncbi:MAG: leucine--tRNA ligase [candidate division Zixibacteria bacterium]|nr:leucine--tRNA ligase [candidate division Zixibacteria bacterium]